MLKTHSACDIWGNVFWFTSTWRTHLFTFIINIGKFKTFLRKSPRCEIWETLSWCWNWHVVVWMCAPNASKFERHFWVFFLFILIFSSSGSDTARRNSAVQCSRIFYSSASPWCFPSLASVWSREDGTAADVTACMHVYRSISQRQRQRWFPRAGRDIDPSNPAQCWAAWLGRMLLYHTCQWLWLQHLNHFSNSTYCPHVSFIHWDFLFSFKPISFFTSSLFFPKK